MKAKLNLAIIMALLLSISIIAQPKNYHETFDVSPGQTLTVKAKTGGSLTVKGWNKNQVEADVKIKGRDADEVEVMLKESSDGVKIVLEFEDSRGNHNTDVSITVSVPEKFNIDYETMGGDVDLDNINGQIEGRTMGGDLKLNKLKGNIETSTMGGDISLTNSVIDGKVSTMGGDITLKDLEGDINAKTMGGDISQTNVKSGKNSTDPIKVSTMGGDIRVDEAINGLDVSTMGGDVSVNHVGNFCDASTMGGDVSVKLLDGWIESETMGGDISVTMSNKTDGKRSAKLKSMGGDITLYVPADLPMQLDLEIVFDDRHENRVEIINDFDLKIEKEYEDDDEQYLKVKTALNGGGNEIKIKTHNGKIYLKKL